MGQHRSRRRWSRDFARGDDRSAFLGELLGTANLAGRSGKANHKDAMLCRQVQRALSLALGACGDDILASCFVDSVEPAPDASHLLVKLIAPKDVSTQDVLECVDRASGTLRYEVAQAISRKRVPSLSWLPISPTSPSPVTPGEGTRGGAR